MKHKNWDNFKVHVTGISKIMSRPRGYNDLTKKDKTKLAALAAIEAKTDEDLALIEFFKQKRERFLRPPLSATAKTYLVERYSAEKYNIRRASTGDLLKPTLAKGVALEMEGIELVKYLDKIDYKRPDCPASNDYLTGQCDILCFENKKIVEVKTSWNAGNFMNNRKDNKLSFYQWCQIQGYLELYDIDHGQVCFVLVNTPQHLIDQEKVSLFKKYTFGEINRDKYEEEIEKYDSLYDYSKIPLTKRIIRFDVARNREFIPLVYDKIEKCREWLNGFERTFLANKNIVALPEDYLNVQYEENNAEHNPDEPHSLEQGG